MSPIVVSFSMENFLRKLRGGAIASLGYLLSPLSWWNDIFFNLPIALVFGYGIAWFNPDWFLSGTLLGYWLSNVIGIVMLQFGAMDLWIDPTQRNITRDLLLGLGGSTIYTIVAALLVYLHLLELPEFLLDLVSPGATP